jgi:hypothetical protein
MRLFVTSEYSKPQKEPLITSDALPARQPFIHFIWSTTLPVLPGRKNLSRAQNRQRLLDPA